MLMAQCCSCAFYLVGFYEIEQGRDDTWLHKNNLIDKTWVVQYINSLYFSFITMITVGFGDITPITSTEKVFCILLALVSCGIFAYTVNQIGAIFQEIERRQSNYKAQRYDVSVYMMQRQINQVIQHKIIKYLDYIQNKQEQSPEKGQKVLCLLPHTLRREFNIDFYGGLLKSQKIFYLNFSNVCIEQLSSKLQEAVYGPGELIYSKGEYDNRIYINIKGTVSIFLDKSQRSDTGENFIDIEKIEQGSVLGQNEFFTGQKRCYSARSQDISHLVYLTQEDFISITKNLLPLDYEQFCQIKNSVQFYDQKMSDICKPCNKFGHNITNCPFIHFTKRIEFLVRKANHSVPQQRQQVLKKRKKEKQSCYKNLQIIKDQLREIRVYSIQQATLNQFLESTKQEDLSKLKNITKQNESLELIGIFEDKDFFSKCKKIKMENGILKIDSEIDIDLNMDDIDEEYDEDYSDSNNSGYDNEYEYKEDYDLNNTIQEFQTDSDQSSDSSNDIKNLNNDKQQIREKNSTQNHIMNSSQQQNPSKFSKYNQKNKYDLANTNYRPYSNNNQKNYPHNSFSQPQDEEKKKKISFLQQKIKNDQVNKNSILSNGNNNNETSQNYLIKQLQSQQKQRQSILNIPFLTQNQQNKDNKNRRQSIYQQIGYQLQQTKNEKHISQIRRKSKILLDTINQNLLLIQKMQNPEGIKKEKNSYLHKLKEFAIEKNSFQFQTQPLILQGNLNNLSLFQQQDQHRQTLDHLFIYDFDSLREYKVYYPEGNMTIICKKVVQSIKKQYQKKKGKKQQQIIKKQGKKIQEKQKITNQFKKINSLNNNNNSNNNNNNQDQQI